MSELPLMNILWLICGAGKGENDQHGNTPGHDIAATQDEPDTRKKEAQAEQIATREGPPEIERGPPEISIEVTPSVASGEAKLLVKDLIGKRSP